MGLIHSGSVECNCHPHLSIFSLLYFQVPFWDGVTTGFRELLFPHLIWLSLEESELESYRGLLCICSAPFR
jgi:hypothetical protein